MEILVMRFKPFLIITVCLLGAGVAASAWLAYDARQQARETKEDVAALSAGIAAVQSATGYFSTLPSEVGGLPRSDSYCAANVTTSTWEPRVDNYTANHTVPSSLSLVPWGSEMNYWGRWVANRSLVTGNYRGTTNQIIQWAACKWGLDENLLRAVAVQESDWHESMVGDICGPVGEASYGLFQIKNKYCSGSWAWGGYDYSAKHSAFNADFYAAYIRSCLDNDFYDGGSWLYGGRTIAQIIARNGFDYALWGCVGSWFSGGWYESGARNYISSVQSHLANKDWLKY
jgi:Transglycosylase SLT domain